MRVMQKPLFFLIMTFILINVAIHVYVKHLRAFKSVTLAYKILDIDVKKSKILVQLDITNIHDKNLTLEAGIPNEFQALEIRSVHDAEGQPMKYSHLMKDEEGHEGEKGHSTSKLVISPIRKQKSVKIVYQVQVGKEILPQNMAMAVKQTNYLPVAGYLSKDFGLFSGRNIFLIPTTKVKNVSVQTQALGNWDIVSTHFDSKQNKLDMLTTVFGIGKFKEYTKRIGQTAVKVFVNDGCANPQSSLANTVFSIYQSITDLFGGTEGETYTLILTPDAKGNRDVWLPKSDLGAGVALTPETEPRWFQLTRNMFDKWSKYLPNSKEDLWLADGVSIYYSIQILSKLGLLNMDQWMLMYHNWYDAIYPSMQPTDDRFYTQKPTYNINLMMDPPKLPNVSSNYINRLFQGKCIVFTAYLDRWIKEQSHGRYSLKDILKERYIKRTKDRSLINDIKRITGQDASQLFAYADGEAKRIPFYEEGIHVLKTHEKPQQNWGRSRAVTFLLSSETEGFLETCGCKVSQSGGVARMATVVRQERKKNPALVLLSVGNAFPNNPTLEEIDQLELEAFLDSFEMMKYNLAAIGITELLYGGTQLKEKVKTVSFPFICANVYHDNQLLLKPYISKKVGQYKIGFLGLIEPFYSIRHISVYQNRTAELSFHNPIETINKYLPMLRKENDLVVLIGRLGQATIAQIIEHTDQIDLIITYHDPNKFSVNSDGEVYSRRHGLGFVKDTAVFVCDGAQYALDKLELDININSKIQSIRHNRLELSESVADAPEVKQHIDNLYAKMTSHTKVGFDKPLYDWRRQTDLKFVGDKTCKSCHSSQYTQWANTKHAFAYNTILEVHRQFVPKCVMCHVTGAGYETGFIFGSSDKKLVNVQCEACHGPGSAHIESPIQFSMLKQSPQELCISCHDKEHSDFDFKTYYPKVVH